MGSPQRILEVADHLARYFHQGRRVVVIASAMAGMTNQLTQYIHDLNLSQLSANHDTVLSAGEQIAAGLLALALEKVGVPARAWLGWQIPIRTTNSPTQAEICHVETRPIFQALEEPCIPIIAGFQGLSSQNRITTLPRGGSDITAIHVADALGVKECFIYTDVAGVYPMNPCHICDVTPWETLHYAHMETLSYLGAKVIHSDAVKHGQQKNIDLWVQTLIGTHSATRIGTDCNLLPHFTACVDCVGWWIACQNAQEWSLCQKFLHQMHLKGETFSLQQSAQGRGLFIPGQTLKIQGCPLPYQSVSRLSLVSDAYAPWSSFYAQGMRRVFQTTQPHGWRWDLKKNALQWVIDTKHVACVLRPLVLILEESQTAEKRNYYENT